MNLDILKKHILDKAIRGELVHQDINDEPVDILLEKIKEEKELLIKEKKIKKEKELPDITNKEIPFDIPSSWKWERLGNMGICKTGTTPSKSNEEYYDGNIPFIKPADINHNYINYNNESLTDLGLKNGRFIDTNSVLMTCIGTIGRSFYTDRICSCNQQINSITPLGNIESVFLNYFLSSEYFNALANKLAVGTTLKVLKKSNWEQIAIPIPPLKEQKRIVNKLDKVFKIIDTMKEYKISNLSNIEQLRKTILDKAIRGELVHQDINDEPVDILSNINKEELFFNIPSSWIWCRLKDIGKIVGGGTPSSTINEYYSDNEISWVTPADLKHIKGKYISNGKRYISELGYNKSSTKMLPKGSILFSSRAPIGYVFINDKELCTNQGFKSIVPNNIEFNEYVYYYLKYVTPYIESISSGTTFKEISGKKFGEVIIPIPPLEEQKRIVEKIDKAFSIIDQMEELLKQL